MSANRTARDAVVAHLTRCGICAKFGVAKKSTNACQVYLSLVRSAEIERAAGK